MSWPQATDYNAAVQNPRVAFADPDLCQAEAVGDLFGLPRPHSGSFADVYQLRAPIPQGSESTGTLYFDVTGAPPNGVVYNDGMQDILMWTSNVPGASAPGAPENSSPAPGAPPSATPAPGALPGPATT